MCIHYLASTSLHCLSTYVRCFFLSLLLLHTFFLSFSLSSCLSSSSVYFNCHWRTISCCFQLVHLCSNLHTFTYSILQCFTLHTVIFLSIPTFARLDTQRRRLTIAAATTTTTTSTMSAVNSFSGEKKKDRRNSSTDRQTELCLHKVKGSV